MSFTDKLVKLEQEKQQLVEKRLLEIAKFADRAGVIGLDNNLIVGAYLYALEAYQNNNQSILEDLHARAKIFPSRRKSISQKNKTAL
jgi:translation elongation factor EF-Tu-like GTPase